MAKPDKAHVWTDAELEKLERRIAAEYKKAAGELTDKINAYFESFKKRDKETKALIGTIVNGREYTEKDYQQWRLAQIGRGRRFEALRDRIAERMTRANEVAAAYINDETPGIYTLNRNYAAYTIEQQVGANVGFDLLDEQTVKRLIVEQPDLMPYYPPERAVKRGIDLAWGKRQITAQVTSGILQGESIGHLADRLQTNIPNMNRDSAIRAARTAVTGAQNAGRQDSYAAAVKMGIKLKKEWLATLDNRTRHDHAAADGQRANQDKPFIVGGEKLMFPGDPAGSGWNIYNCRCTMVAAVEGVDTSGTKRRARDPVTGKTIIIEDMTYSEWAGWKGSTNQVTSVPESGIIRTAPTAAPVVFRRFETGDAVNEFFYYDGEERGLMAQKRSKYGQWEKSLSADQKLAVDAYTTGGYADLNDFLRKRGDWNSIDSDTMTQFRDDLRSVISGFELKEPIRVYRYTGKDTFNVELEKLVGQEWSDAGFMSTSPAMQGVESAVVSGKDYLLEIEVPAGKGIGAYLNNLSPWKDTEYEFLLKDGTKFEIISIDTSGDKPIIRMAVKA